MKGEQSVRVEQSVYVDKLEIDGNQSSIKNWKSIIFLSFLLN